MRKTVRHLVLEYFAQHPRQEVQQRDVATWVQKEYEKLYGQPCMDPWREVRRLYQEGLLAKIRKGVYVYDPDVVSNRRVLNFPPEVRDEIFRRDGYRCVFCGRGPAEGLEIHADHIVPLERGGDNSVDNGQTLCSEHNIFKKYYSQTEFGKRLFLRLYKQALANEDQRMIRFCQAILRVYDEYDINSHISAAND